MGKYCWVSPYSIHTMELGTQVCRSALDGQTKRTRMAIQMLLMLVTIHVCFITIYLTQRTFGLKKGFEDFFLKEFAAYRGRINMQTIANSEYINSHTRCSIVEPRESGRWE